MELQQEQTKHNIERMMTDVNAVISEHLNTMLSELHEKNKDMMLTYNLLQNLPIIVNFENKLKKANDDIELLKSSFIREIAPTSPSVPLINSLLIKPSCQCLKLFLPCQSATVFAKG